MSTTEVTKFIEIASLRPSETFGVMRDGFVLANQHMPNWNLAQLSVATRRVPLCYSRRAISHEIDEARMSAQGKAVLVALTILTGAAAILLFYGGWGM